MNLSLSNQIVRMPALVPALVARLCAVLSGPAKLASVVAALSVATLPLLEAQVVSSGLSGLVRDSQGKPVSGATVQVTYGPTGTPYTTSTNADGRYNFRGL